MYPEYMQESLRKVEETRPKRAELAKTKGMVVYPPMSEEERKEVLTKFHPDYKPEAKRPVRVGPNKGELVVSEVADLLESHSRIDPDKFDLEKVDYDTDVLVIGGGGAGCEAAIWAMREGAKVILATKLRLGDSNTMMAQGGTQAATNPGDSPVLHFLDTIGGGHFDNKPELVRILVTEAPMAIKWLEEWGVMWDKTPDGYYLTAAGGGACRRRLHCCRDYTGAMQMRVLADEVRNHPDWITVLEFMPAVELILDEEGRCAGAILYNLETEEYYVVRAKSVVLATGGFGRLHIQGFATTNHYGATCDGVVMAYRAGAKLLHMDSVQYHPTGAVFPEQIAGFLITEKIRGFGAQPVNKHGELFVYPLEPRDVEAAAYIRECLERGNGIVTPWGRVGVWLDTPLIDILHGEGTTKNAFPAMYRQFKRFGIEIDKEPILTYPTLHYQNGGVEINERCETNVPGLYCAGEVSGGVHGRNRLMGNSTLELHVFGRRAGIYAAQNAKSTKLGRLTLEHVKRYERELEEAGIVTDRISPMLLPDYTPKHVKERQLTAHYEGTLR